MPTANTVVKLPTPWQAEQTNFARLSFCRMAMKINSQALLVRFPSPRVCKHSPRPRCAAFKQSMLLSSVNGELGLSPFGNAEERNHALCCTYMWLKESSIYGSCLQTRCCVVSLILGLWEKLKLKSTEQCTIWGNGEERMESMTLYMLFNT